MTKAQERTIEQIKKAIPKFDFYGHPDDYEIKRWEVKETDYGKVIVIFETGRKGDEGTMASILCRKHRQIFIGSRGGMECYVYDTKKKKCRTIKGFFKCMNEGYEH